jgi:Tfp pilus assembly protein PilF
MWWLFGCLVCFGGCQSPNQERIQDYSHDGLHLYELGDYAAARESFQAALALQPDDPTLLYNVAECYDRAGDAPKAERYYIQCLQTAPNHAECHHALVGLLVRVGRREDAQRMVQDWLAREPRRAAACAEDGWLWYQAGDLPRAQVRLQEALAIDPQEPLALIELAQVYEAMNRPDRAVALYERALERNPRQIDVVKRLELLRAQGVKAPHPD